MIKLSELSEEKKIQLREAIRRLIRHHLKTRRLDFLRKQSASSQNDNWRIITNEEMVLVGNIAMELSQQLGIHDVDGLEWSELVLAVFRVELSAIGHRHDYSPVYVNSANRQLETDTKNRMHSSIQAAAKAHGIKKQKLWRRNSRNSASQFGGPIAFGQEDHNAIMMAVVDVLLHHS